MKFDCSLYLVADTGMTERRKLDKKVELAIEVDARWYSCVRKMEI